MASTMQDNILSSGYDAVYAATPASPTLRRLWAEHVLGPDFPPEFGHISFVTLSQLRRMAEELRLSPDRTLVDLGCGMGGPALWMANESGASLIGVDLSPVAVELATSRAAQLGLSSRTQFVHGSFAETGLENQSVHAAMSEDALQYAPDKLAAMTEIKRILQTGGRFVFTAFELDPDRASGLPILGEDPVSDYRGPLEHAGFLVELYEKAPGWPEPMTTVYQSLLSAREALSAEMGDRALTALFAELTITLERRPYHRRVFVSATKA